MIARGFDGASERRLAGAWRALASERLGREVPVMRFDELDADRGLRRGLVPGLAAACSPRTSCPASSRASTARSGPAGWHWASYKDGAGGGRDEFGRFFSYIPADRLEAAYRAAAAWAELEHRHAARRPQLRRRADVWHDVLARK